MIHYKTEEEIRAMIEGGEKLKKAVSLLLPQIKVGMSTKEIDDEAERLIRLEGAEPGFKRVKGYSWTTCLPINEQVVHTPPSKRVLKEGDVLTVDIGAYYKGMNTDYATTFVLGKRDEKKDRFLKVGEETLYQAIKQAKLGNYLGQISKAIETNIYKNGYFIQKQLTGHGVGKTLHEDPFIPGYLDRAIEKTTQIRQGLVIAIEVIYAMGSEEIAYEKGNDWSITSADKSLTACFEHTIAITDKETIVLT